MLGELNQGDCMNERLKELAEQAGFEKQTHLFDSWECGLKELERFAELVRDDEREWVGLTDDEMLEIWRQHGSYEMLFKKVEIKLKDKNTT